MKNIIIFTAAILTGFSAFAGDIPVVKLKQDDKAIQVEIGGKPFTTYWFADGNGAPYVRPFMHPVLAADGTPVTDDQVQTKGDHPHHRSLWVAHGEVNDADHWSIKAGADSPKQRHIAFSKMESDGFEQQLEWEAKDHSPMLKETRTVRFFGFPDGARGIDISCTFDPIVEKVTFGDTKEAGICSVRMVKSIAVSGTITNSNGATGEKECWGKAATWCDISGKANNKIYGIAILDHPGNPKHPSRWHVRQYGLMGANIFGLSYFDKGTPKKAGDFTIEKGKPVTFRYRVVIHENDAKAANLDGKFKEFAEKK